MLIPQQDLRITYNYTPGFANSIDNFTITTPDGVKYFFGKTESTTDVDPVEKTHFFDEEGTIGTNNILSSWYLNKISSPDDVFSISLTYTTEEYKYVTMTSFPVAANDPGAEQNPLYEYKLLENWVQGVRLTQIEFSSGKVDFEAGPSRLDLKAYNAPALPSNETVNSQAKALGAIRIYNNAGSYCRKFIMNYSYFEDNTSPLPQKYASLNLNLDKKRLRLDTLIEQSCDASIIQPPHVFEYFSETVTRRLSLGYDHWGFMNGKTDNNHLIPTYQDESTTYGFVELQGADRESNWPAMRGGTLKRMIYPTGGFTEFEFEPNDTWVSFEKYTLTPRDYFSMGYGGVPDPVEQIETLTSNPYKFKISNSIEGGNSSLHVYDNSNHTNTVLILTASPGQTQEKTIRLPAGQYWLVLSKIDPSGGNGVEAYLSEYALIYTQGNKSVGGLRIRTITHNDALTSKNIITTYSYRDGSEHSTGILYGRPTYFAIERNDFIKDAGVYTINPGENYYCSFYGCTTCGDVNDVPYIKSPNSVRPMDNSQGNHIGYSEVKVSQVDNGYSIYRYYGSNIWDIVQGDVVNRYVDRRSCNLNIPNYPAAPPPFEPKRGALKYEGYYAEGTQLIKDINYYPIYQDYEVKTPALIASQNIIQYEGLPTFYELKTARLTEMGITQDEMAPGVGYIQTTTTTFYESQFHNQPTRKVTTNSKGETLETKYKYAADFRLASCDNIPDGFQTYTTTMTNCFGSTYRVRLLILNFGTINNC